MPSFKLSFKLNGHPSIQSHDYSIKLLRLIVSGQRERNRKSAPSMAKSMFGGTLNFLDISLFSGPAEYFSFNFTQRAELSFRAAHWLLPIRLQLQASHMTFLSCLDAAR